ncbi:hypothetical protein L211DRAFT_440674 [Terfezia boudieri ATCC MYA-4762]|uniref:Uncharacterized protein n=1 Tax=Terfezia boudieri ATCC MYA-4762 TaxID=1051890 RepID=A0A3N4LF70_9PEZI|nr:hypothetical protein L211DRAFT_440674 [Terfezia boudieri ATCC MYA-4762]
MRVSPCIPGNPLVDNLITKENRSYEDLKGRLIGIANAGNNTNSALLAQNNKARRKRNNPRNKPCNQPRNQPLRKQHQVLETVPTARNMVIALRDMSGKTVVN